MLQLLLTFLVAKLLFNLHCLSVRQSVRNGIEECYFLAARQLKFFMKIPCIIKHPVYDLLGPSVIAGCRYPPPK